LTSTARNARLLLERAALALGLAIGPVLAFSDVQFDLLWTGVIGGTLSPSRAADAERENMSAELHCYLILIVIGFLPSEVWRWLGIALGRGLDEQSEIILWVRGVATALIAGVIARIVLIPPGALAGVPLPVRLAALAGGFLGFLLIRRSAFAGVVVGEGLLVAGALVFS